jgi:hypothetical protein
MDFYSCIIIHLGINFIKLHFYFAETGYLYS